MQNTGNVSFGINYGFIPKEGPREIPKSYDFTATATYREDLFQAQVTDQLEFVQGLYVDNFDNAAALTITADITGQRVVIPPSGGGYVPFFLPKDASVTVTSTIAAVTATIHYLSFCVPACVWKKT